MKSATPKKAKRTTARANDADHLAFVRQLPCLITGKPAPNEAAHIRYGSRQWGKPQTGIGVKPHDIYVVPLSADVHRDQHANGEKKWWEARGIDPIVISIRLYLISGDIDAGIAIINDARTK